MFQLIETISESSCLNIEGNQYRVLAKVKYVTETETTNWYVKIQLENHYVLVIAPYDEYMYFGYVGEAYPCDFPTPDSIKYDGDVYIKEAEDYQMVKEFLGSVERTQKRADVYAKVIKLEDVTVIRN